MTIPDFINGFFEFTSGLMIWINVAAIIKDKKYSGVRILPLAFFSSWSFWNLYYYPHLNQWASFFGGLSIGIANAAYLTLMVKYGKGEK